MKDPNAPASEASSVSHREPGVHPRPPDLRPPSSLRAVRRASDYKAYIELASLQMARDRQRRIRAALRGQMARCTRRIEQIEREAAALKARIEQNEASSSAEEPADPTSGFEYRY